MSRTRRQHYVHRAYLREFATDKEQIFVFDLQRRKSFQTNIRNVAVETDFHEVPPDVAEQFGSEMGQIEELCSDYEDLHSKVMKLTIQRAQASYLMHNEYPVIPYEHADSLASAVLFQAMRTREFRRRTLDTWDSVGTALMRWFVEADETLEVAPETFDLRTDPKHHSIVHLLRMFDADLTDEILDKWLDCFGFFILRAPPGTKFLCSDHPVVRHNHFDRPAGMLREGTEIMMPLNPTFAVTIRSPLLWDCEPDRAQGSMINLRPENVEWYNSQMVLQAHTQVFSSDSDFRWVRGLVEENPGIGTHEWFEKEGMLINGRRIFANSL